MDDAPKLFSLPGAVDEGADKRKQLNCNDNYIDNDVEATADVALLGDNVLPQITTNLPKNLTLIRVSTAASSLGNVGRQDSTR